MGFSTSGNRISPRYVLPLFCAATLLSCVGSPQESGEEPGPDVILEVDLFTASFFYLKKYYPEIRLTPTGEALYIRSEEGKFFWDEDLHTVIIRMETTPKQYEIFVEHSNTLSTGNVDSSDTSTYRRDDLAVAWNPGTTPERNEYYYPAHPWFGDPVDYEIRTITRVSDFVAKYYVGKGFQVVTPIGLNPWGNGIGKIRIRYR